MVRLGLKTPHIKKFKLKKKKTPRSAAKKVNYGSVG
jgi:hypothetical protein